MTRLQQLLLVVAIIFAVGYVATLEARPYPGDFVVKSIPGLGLAALALRTVPGWRGRLLSAALLFCAAGDAALAYEDGENLTVGLGLFLVAQVLFVITFTRDFKFQISRVPGAVSLAAYAVLMALILRPSLEDMALPVYIYLAVITVMGMTAAFRHPTSILVICGALFFIASDSMLAMDEFRGSFAGSVYLVMITYYLAIFFIACGFVMAFRLTPSHNQTRTP